MSDPSKRREMLRKSRSQTPNSPTSSSTETVGSAFPPPPRPLEEEQPTMRSVAIMGAPVGGETIGLASLRRVETLYSSKEPELAVRPTTLPGEPKQERKHHLTKDAQYTWTVTTLKPLPTDFPLEKTSRRVSDSSGSAVAMRINKCLRMCSIEAKYNDAEGKAKCRTADFVFFCIKLFSDSDNVIVEIQRRRGNSNNFKRHCCAILDAAEGCFVNPSPSFPDLKHVSNLACLKGVKIDEDETAALDESISTIGDLLAKDGRDANMLGIKKLEFLTNPLYSSQETVRNAARRVIIPQSNSPIQDAISTFLQFNVLSAYRRGAEEFSHDHEEYMHNISLSVVHNCVIAIAEEGNLADVLKSKQQWFLHTLLPVLVHDIGSAKNQPHNACLAAKCINCLAGCAPFVRESIVGAGAIDALSEACIVGAGSHDSLSEVSDRTVRLLLCP